MKAPAILATTLVVFGTTAHLAFAQSASSSSADTRPAMLSYQEFLNSSFCKKYSCTEQKREKVDIWESPIYVVTVRPMNNSGTTLSLRLESDDKISMFSLRLWMLAKDNPPATWVDDFHSMVTEGLKLFASDADYSDLLSWTNKGLDTELSAESKDSIYRVWHGFEVSAFKHESPFNKEWPKLASTDYEFSINYFNPNKKYRQLTPEEIEKAKIEREKVEKALIPQPKISAKLRASRKRVTLRLFKASEFCRKLKCKEGRHMDFGGTLVDFNTRIPSVIIRLSVDNKNRITSAAYNFEEKQTKFEKDYKEGIGNLFKLFTKPKDAKNIAKSVDTVWSQLQKDMRTTEELIIGGYAVLTYDPYDGYGVSIGYEAAERYQEPETINSLDDLKKVGTGSGLKIYKFSPDFLKNPNK